MMTDDDAGRPGSEAPTSDAEADRLLRARGLGAGLAMLVVVLSYDASGLGTPARWWATGVALVVGVLLADLLGVQTGWPDAGLGDFARALDRPALARASREP